VRGENYYPGWHAFVDGNAVEVLRVNYNLRGVAVPAGTHLVRFVYRPNSLLLGALLSLLAAILLSLWCLRRPRGRLNLTGERRGWWSSGSSVSR